MNKIERAIIMAAGIGQRMHPLTYKTPKPLIEVNGQRMIESIIESLHKNHIEEIYVVVGYLKEQFTYLKDKYHVTLIDNPYYDHCNNIASLYVARNYIHNTLILDGDQIIYNDDIFYLDFDKSGYNVIYTDEETKEWVLDVKDGVVQKCHRDGALRGYQLFSVSRWNNEDGYRLKKHLEIEFEEKKNHQIYWDDVALFCHFDEYQLGIYEMKKGDILEIDSYEELKAIDSSYKD